MNTHKKLFGLSKADRKQAKLFNNCKTKASIYSFTMVLDANGENCSIFLSHFLQAMYTSRLTFTLDFHAATI